MQFAYVNDLVQAMVRAMEEPRAVGEAFNIGDPKPVTQFELVEKLAKVANTEATLARIPRDLIVQAGGNPMEEPYYFGEYFDLPPITENIGKVTRMLKMKLTPFEAGLKETYRWYTRNHKPRTAGFEFDDKALGLARAGSPASV
jgi:nucleoside-diphosphate-sugar epimerase